MKCYLKSLFGGNFKNLGGLFVNTFRDGIELFLEGEGEKKLPQPRRANACCGRIVEVPFKEKGSDITVSMCISGSAYITKFITV